MQFTDGGDWSLFDFAIMSLLLLTVGLSCEFVLRKAKTKRSRLLLGSLVLFIFLIIWAELGVGIFGTPFAGD